jgi:hypothetical protein
VLDRSKEVDSQSTEMAPRPATFEGAIVRRGRLEMSVSEVTVPCGDPMDFPPEIFEQYSEIHREIMQDNEDLRRADWESQQMILESKLLDTNLALENALTQNKRLQDQCLEANETVRKEKLKAVNLEKAKGDLQRQLFMAFDCKDFSQVIQCGAKLAEFRARISSLESSLIETRTELAQQKLTQKNTGAAEERVAKLLSDLEIARDTIRAQGDTLVQAEAARKGEVEGLKDELRRKQKEVESLQSQVNAFLAETKKRSQDGRDAKESEACRRLQTLKILSQRLERARKASTTSPFKDLFDRLSRLFGSTSNINLDSDDMTQCWEAVIEETDRLANHHHGQLRRPSGEEEELKTRIKTLEDSIRTKDREIIALAATLDDEKGFGWEARLREWIDRASVLQDEVDRLKEGSRQGQSTKKRGWMVETDDSVDL